jgi:hypothetical protein
MEAGPALEGSEPRPVPPVLMLGRRSPYLYAEPTVEQAEAHLAWHAARSESFRQHARDYDYFDGDFRPLRLVISAGATATLGLAGTTPQPHQVRGGLRRVLDWMELLLLGHDLLVAADDARETAGKLLPRRELAAGRQALTAAAQAVAAAEALPAEAMPLLLQRESAAALRRGIEDLDPATDDLGKLLDTLAERFRAPLDITVAHPGGLLHNVLHAAGWRH